MDCQKELSILVNVAIGQPIACGETINSQTLSVSLVDTSGELTSGSLVDPLNLPSTYYIQYFTFNVVAGKMYELTMATNDPALNTWIELLEMDGTCVKQGTETITWIADVTKQMQVGCSTYNEFETGVFTITVKECAAHLFTTAHDVSVSLNVVAGFTPVISILDSTGTLVVSGETITSELLTPGDYWISVISNSGMGGNYALSMNCEYVPPVANYNVTPSDLYIHTDVPRVYTDTSTGRITSWLWNFGDGSTSTEQNPTHTFNPNQGAGSPSITYVVSLTVTGPDGTNTKTVNVIAWALQSTGYLFDITALSDCSGEITAEDLYWVDPALTVIPNFTITVNWLDYNWIPNGSTVFNGNPVSGTASDTHCTLVANYAHMYVKLVFTCGNYSHGPFAGSPISDYWP